MLIESTEENKEIIGDAFADELIEKWFQGRELPNNNTENIATIRRETGWDLWDCLDCYRKMIQRRKENIMEIGYSILGAGCLYYHGN